MKYALLYTGQGAQRPGMGKDLFDKYKSAQDVFAEADSALGFALSDIIFNGMPEDLMKTAVTQPAILTMSIAAHRAMEEELGFKLTPDCVAGHSLGEYTSLVASGVLSLSSGVKLVRLRGELMQNAVPEGVGSMAAIIGLSLSEVTAVCEEASRGEVCQAANVNAPTQVVISGHAGAVERAVAAIESSTSAKVVPLRVSAPFHCSLMKPVAEKLKEAFSAIEWHEPLCPVIANASASAVSTVNDIKDALFTQTFSPVLWSNSVLAMDARGIAGYVEFGPGSVLSGLVRKISKGKKPYPVSDSAELLKAAEFLKGV